jgi:hypothetical protein
MKYVWIITERDESGDYWWPRLFAICSTENKAKEIRNKLYGPEVYTDDLVITRIQLDEIMEDSDD